MVRIIIGALLIVLQVLSFIGNAAAGMLMIPTSLGLGSIVHFLGYYSFSIVGVILIAFGIRALVKKNGEA